MKSRTYTLITGASSGIGKEFAYIAAHEQQNIVLVARSEEALTVIADQLRNRFDIEAEIVACDLSRPEAVPNIVASLKSKNISINVLINNAGFGDYGEFINSNEKTQLAMIDLNVRALTQLTHHFLPEMVSRGSGKIMNVASVAGFLPGPLMSVYFASKAYVLSFSEALAEEVNSTGVTITCLCPGSTKTGFGDTANTNKTHSTQTSSVTASQVARYGWDSMQKGKKVAVHGSSNRFSVWLVRFLPRAVVARIVHNINN